MNDDLDEAVTWLASGPMIPQGRVVMGAAWEAYKTDMRFVGVVRRLGQTEDQLMAAASVACIWQKYWWENYPDDWAAREWHCDQWLGLVEKMRRVEGEDL